eukprot:3414536-Prymnesium_polylepis.1
MYAPSMRQANEVASVAAAFLSVWIIISADGVRAIAVQIRNTRKLRKKLSDSCGVLPESCIARYHHAAETATMSSRLHKSIWMRRRAAVIAGSGVAIAIMRSSKSTVQPMLLSNISELRVSRSGGVEVVWRRTSSSRVTVHAVVNTANAMAA